MAGTLQEKCPALYLYPWWASFICVSAALLLAYYRLLPLALLITLFLLGLTISKYGSSYSLKAALLLIVTCLFFYPSFQPLPESLPEISDTMISGTIASIPDSSEGRTRFILNTGQEPKYHRHYQVVCRFSAPVHKGDRIWLSGDLQPPHRPGNPGEFDYRRYLYHKDIYYILSVPELEEIEKIETADGWQGAVNRYRDRVTQVTGQYLTKEEAIILRGMLLGETDDMDPQLYDEFQETGIIHLFSVSGLHIGFLLLLSAWVSSLLGARRSYRLLIGVVVLIVYGTLISWPVPVIRASLMGGLGLLAYYSGRPHQMLNSLGMAGIVILLIDPHALFTISFQLSFLAAWGLIYLFPAVRQRLKFKGFWADAILVPVCAQLAVVPVLAYYFNMISPVSVLANLLVTYLSGGVVILGFISLFLVACAPLAVISLAPAGLLIELIILATHICASIPSGVLWVATPCIAAMLLYYTGLLIWLDWPPASSCYRYTMGAGLLLIMLFFLWVAWPPAWRDRGIMEVVFVDVGQGDSILIKSPQGRFILVDGGGSDFYQVGEMKLIPYLRHRGIRSIDMMINTHPDTDHLKGLEEVLAEIPVDIFAYPSALESYPRYQTIFQQNRSTQMALTGLRAGQTLRIEDDCFVDVLYPAADTDDGDLTNHHSLILRCRYGTSSFLLLGDVDAEGIYDLMEKHHNLSSDVVKVPHHGSRSSLAADFYQQNTFTWSVISVGDNQFGHPHQEVIDMLEGQKIRIYRTDQQGMIRFSSDGNQIQAESYWP